MNQSQCVSFIWSLYFLTKNPNMTFETNKNLNTDRIVDIKNYLFLRYAFEIPFQDFPGGLDAPSAGDLGLIPGQGTRSPMLQKKICMLLLRPGVVFLLESLKHLQVR